MFSGLDKVSGYLDQRFLTNAFFPSLAFSGALLSLAIAHWGWDALFGSWQTLGGEAQALLVAGAIGGLLAFSSFLNVEIFSLLRLYEGYWGEHGLSKRLADWRKSSHQEIFGLLAIGSNQDYQTLYRYYPSSITEVMPTRLGNVLKSAESYASDEKRYKMDAVFFWPRLFAVLPDVTREALRAARSGLEYMIVVSALSWLFAILATIYLASVGRTEWLFWMIAVGGGFVVGRLAYLRAVQVAAIYAELVKSAFDLYRIDLIKQMGYALPKSLESERVFWASLGQQLYARGTANPEALQYAAAKSSDGESVWQKLKNLLSFHHESGESNK